MKWALTRNRRSRLLCKAILANGESASEGLLSRIKDASQASPAVPMTSEIVAATWLYSRGQIIQVAILSGLAVSFFFLPPVEPVLSSVAAVACALGLMFVVASIHQLQARSQKIAFALCQFEKNVENRVQQRIDDLFAANQSLTAEIQQRRQSEREMHDSESKLRIALTAMEAALKEKELQLRELQHRIKNNFQLICSVLSLHAGRTHDAAIREIMSECQTRVRAIALVHDMLSRAQNLKGLDLEYYLGELVQSLLRCYSGKLGAVHPQIRVEQVILDTDQVIPFALIVNELVCNALKYAFPEGSSGEIRVEVRKHNCDVTLIVADNGVGLATGASGENGIGQQIVQALVDQLSGKLEWANGHGTTAMVTFPATAETGGTDHVSESNPGG